MYEWSYCLRCISFWFIISSSFYEGCRSDKRFQIHFKQVVSCFCLRWVAQLLLGPDFLCWEGGEIFGIMWFCHLVALLNSMGFGCIATRVKKSWKYRRQVPWSLHHLFEVRNLRISMQVFKKLLFATAVKLS